MRITVKAKRNAKEYRVEKISDKEFKVSVKESPVEGRANEAIIRTLADYFDISKSRIRIVSGRNSTNKIIDVT